MPKRYDQRVALSRAFEQTGLIKLGWASPIMRGQKGQFVSLIQAKEQLQLALGSMNAAVDAEQIIAFLDARVNKMDVAKRIELEYRGRVFSVIWGTGAIEVLNEGTKTCRRIQTVMQNEMYITEKMRGNSQNRILPYLLEVIKSMAEGIMHELIYDQPEGSAQIIYYNVGKGGKIGEGSSEDFWPPYQRTENLLNAVIQGITLQGNMIHFAIDDNLAPYWLWVDRGHRVFIPIHGEVYETGAFVVGRPFFERINDAISNLMNNIVMQNITGNFAGVVQRIGNWALYGSKTTMLPYSGNYAVQNYPKQFSGYTPAFGKWVGLQA